MPTIPILLLALLAPALGACGGEQVAVTEPKQVSENTFDYPEELWDAGVEGETTLALWVSAAGTVDSARVERSSGYPAFDSAALVGGRRLRFDPARKGEEAIPTWVSLPVRFTLPADQKAALAASDTVTLPADDNATAADTAAPDSAAADTTK